LPAGSYARIEPGRKQPLRCQQALLDHHGERFSARAEKAARKKSGPKRRLPAGTELEPEDEKRSRRA